MRRFFVFFLALPTIALCTMAGCGAGGESEATAQVSPEFKKETNNMLDKMSKDAMAKYKTKGAPKH